MLQISLRAARVNRGYAIKDVSARIGVHPSTVYNWEKGRSAPDFVQMKKLCALYGLTVDDITIDKSPLKAN